MANHEFQITICRSVLTMILACGFASAATINIGVLSLDVLIPGAPGAPGVNAFTVGNFTGDPAGGGFALPPDFPVVEGLTFGQSTLLLKGSSAPGGTVSLGDLGPGFDQPGTLQFPDTVTFTSAVFAGTLNLSRFLLADGTTFIASSRDITATVLPSVGAELAPGTDAAVITVSGRFAAVPEPSTCLMMATAVGTLLLRRRRVP